MLAWQLVGLRTHAQTILSPEHALAHAQSVFMHVRAANQVPRSLSKVVTGSALLIDRNPPYLAGGCTALTGQVVNGEFSTSSGPVMPLSKLSPTWWKALSRGPPTDWAMTGPNAAAQVIASPFSHNGGKFVLVRGSITQEVRTTPGKPHVLIFFVADAANWRQRAFKGGMVRIGEAVKAAFEVRGKAEGERLLTWRRKAFFFRPTSVTTRIELGTLASEVDGLAFDSVTLHECRAASAAERGLHVDIENVGDFVRLFATWSAHDDESGLAELLWALGTSEGGIQYKPYRRISPLNAAVQTPLLRIPHGTPLHFSLLVINRAGLAIVGHSWPIKVDLTPATVTAQLITATGKEINLKLQMCAHTALSSWETRLEVAP